ncbi:hypothetical protein GEMRC1_011258 [Eukaryota sp. GEM-RC1]
MFKNNSRLRKLLYFINSIAIMTYLFFYYVSISLAHTESIKYIANLFGITLYENCTDLVCPSHIRALAPLVINLIISTSFLFTSVHTLPSPSLTVIMNQIDVLAPAVCHTIAVVLAWGSVLTAHDPFSIIFGVIGLPFISSHNWRHRKKLVLIVMIGLGLGVVSRLFLASLCVFKPDQVKVLTRVLQFFGVSCPAHSLYPWLLLPVLSIFALYRSLSHPLDLRDSEDQDLETVSPLAYKIESLMLPLLRPFLVLLLFFIGVQRATFPAFVYVVLALWLVLSDAVFTKLKFAKAFTSKLYILNMAVLITQSLFQLKIFKYSDDVMSLPHLLGLEKYSNHYDALSFSGSILDLFILAIASSLDVLVYSASFKRYLASVRSSRLQAAKRLVDDERLAKRRREAILEEREAEKVKMSERLEKLRDKRMRRKEGDEIESWTPDGTETISKVVLEEQEVEFEHYSKTVKICHKAARKLQLTILSFFRIKFADLPPRHQSYPLLWSRHSVYRYSSTLAAFGCFYSALWFPSLPTLFIAFSTITFALMKKYGGSAKYWQTVLGVYLVMLLVHYIFSFPFLCYCSLDGVVIRAGRMCINASKCPVPREILDPYASPGKLSAHLVYLFGIAPIGSILFSYPPLLLAALGIVLHRSISLRMGRWEAQEEEQDWKKYLKGILEYFKNLTKPDFDPIGVDLYPFIFLIDILQLFILPFAFFSSSAATESVVQSVKLSYLPGYLAIWLIVQFFLIILDRTFFFLRLAKLKAIMHVISNFVVLLVFCFIFPRSNNELPIFAPFLVVAAIFRFLAACLSSIQLRFGYPPPSSSHFLMRDYSSFYNYGYQVFRMIPFLYELRTLLDWTLTTTSLEFNYWQRVEDIYSSLFLIKCRRVKNAKLGRQLGDPQPFMDKLLQGFLLFFGLILILVIPLILFSSANPVSKANPVTQGSIDVSINNYLPIFSLHELQSVATVSSSVYNELRRNFSIFDDADNEDIRKLTFFTSSDSIWTITPPALNGLVDSLESGKGVVTISLIFHRAYPSESRSSHGSFSYKLNWNECQTLAALFKGNVTVVEFELLPRAVLVPTSESPIFSNIREKVLLSRKESGGIFWLIKETDSGEPFSIYTYSQEITAGLGAYASGGLIGLYVSIIIGVGRFLRLSFSDSKAQIFVSALPAPDRLIFICQDLFLARSHRDLVLEESIYKELIQIYRDPELLIQLTEKTTEVSE